jgi:hypothetical protein
MLGSASFETPADPVAGFNGAVTTDYLVASIERIICQPFKCGQSLSNNK